MPLTVSRALFDACVHARAFVLAFGVRADGDRLFVAYSICANGPQIFALEVGELFTCDLGDGTLYKALAEKFRTS